jgi:N-acetylglucosamine-6-phosphate deacetylase
MRHLVLGFALLLTACTEPTVEPGLKAIVGGRLEIVPDADPIEYSVIVIAGGKIQALGPQALTPVPKGAETISAKGQRILPATADTKLLVGEPADLMFIDAQTGVRGRIMKNGEWVQ